MSGITLTEVDDATIATPASGKQTIFVDDTIGPARKDDTGTVTSLTGATGSTGPGYGGTSTTSLAIGTGSKAFTTQSGKAWVAGSRVRAASAADPDGDWMEGVCTAYSGTTLTVLMDLTSGSGTHTDWNLTLTGEAPARWLGAWDSGTAYTEGDAVSNDGSSYVCILAHTNQEPPDGTYWDVLAQGAPAEILDLTTAETDDTLVLAPDGAGGVEFRAETGGGGGTTVVTDLVTLTAGSITLNSTSWAEAAAATGGPGTGGLDLDFTGLTAGDVVWVTLSTYTNSAATYAYFTFATMVGGSPVNFIMGHTGASTGDGASCWAAVANREETNGGVISYVLQSGDLSTGALKLRLYYRTSAATNRTLFGTAANPLHAAAVVYS